jgi:hypothetical protein
MPVTSCCTLIDTCLWGLHSNLGRCHMGILSSALWTLTPTLTLTPVLMLVPVLALVLVLVLVLVWSGSAPIPDPTGAVVPFHTHNHCAHVG